MGYDIHITRKEDWVDDGPHISLEEWLAVVKSDPELRLDGFAEAHLPDGKILRVEDESIAVWTAYSRHSEGRIMAMFDLSSGNVVAKNPDQEVIRKMWRLAQRLNARVQGDDGEFYDEQGNGRLEVPLSETAPPLWRRLFSFLRK